MSGKKYIIANGDRKVNFSDVVADCNLNLCVPTKVGEPLTSVLQKICAKIGQGGGGGKTFIQQGENIVIDGEGTATKPYIISAESALKSVGLQMPSGFSVSNSPITSSGTIKVTTTLGGIVWAKGGSFLSADVDRGLSFVDGTLKTLYEAGEGLTLDENFVFSHADTSNVEELKTVGTQVIESLKFDKFGHVIGFTLRNLSVEDDDDGSLYGDEEAQDAVGRILKNTESISFTYNDEANEISADVSSQYVTNIVNEIIEGIKSKPNGIVPLNSNGVIEDQFLPRIKILTVRTLNERDNLTSRLGDIVKVLDVGGHAVDYIWDGSQWFEFSDYIGILSINGETGTEVILDSDDIDEGLSNLYYTPERVDDRVAALIRAGTNIGIVYNDDANTLTINSTSVYTNEQAQDAVGAILTNTSSINVLYDDTVPSIKLSINDSYIFNLLKKIEIRFVVGVSEGFTNGTTTFYLKDCSGNLLTNKKIRFFRERFREWEGTDFTYDPTTALMTLSIPFKTNDRCVIEVEDDRMWSICNYVEGASPTTREFSNDFLLTEFN